MTPRILRSGKGATIVEFAIVFPMLLILIFGAMDFGFYFFVQHTIQFATREGVRLALVGRTITDAGGNQLTREQSIVKTIRDRASIAVRGSDLAISIYPVDGTFADPTGWQTTQNAGDPGSYMRVRTRYTYHFITPLIPLAHLVVANTRVIEAQATYKNELFE